MVHAARGAMRDEGMPAVIPGRRPARRRRWALSLGASVLMLVALVAVVQGLVGQPGQVVSPRAGFAVQLASFISSEHERTTLDSDAARTKFRCTDFTRICPDFSPQLGESPSMPTLGGIHELRFQGAAPCGVPGGGPSIHVRFYTLNDQLGHRHEVSLFVQRDAGQLKLDEGRVYSLDCRRARVCVWRSGMLVYYLVSDDEHGCKCVRDALGIADPTGRIRAR